MCLCEDVQVLNGTRNSCTDELPCLIILLESTRKKAENGASICRSNHSIKPYTGDPLTALPCIDHRTSNRTKKPNHWSWETPVRWQVGFHKATPLGRCRSPEKCFQKSKENKLSTWYNSGAIYYPKRSTGVGKECANVWVVHMDKPRAISFLDSVVGWPSLQIQSFFVLCNAGRLLASFFPTNYSEWFHALILFILPNLCSSCCSESNPFYID